MVPGARSASGSCQFSPTWHIFLVVIRLLDLCSKNIFLGQFNYLAVQQLEYAQFLFEREFQLRQLSLVSGLGR